MTYYFKRKLLLDFFSILCISLTLIDLTALPVLAQTVTSVKTRCLDKDYILFLTALSWEAARIKAQEASNVQGHLAIINSSAENDCLAAFIASQSSQIKAVSSALASGGGIHYVWLGATDDVSEGTWKWIDGEKFYPSATSYKNWGSGPLGTEPDNVGNQDHLAMALDAWPSGRASGTGIGRAGQWNDITGSALNTFIVEVDSAALLNGDNYSVIPKIWKGENNNNSYFRLQNNSASKLTAEIKVVGGQTGRVHGATQYEVDPLTAKQRDWETILSDALVNPPTALGMGDNSFQLYIKPTKGLLFSHVIWNSRSGFFENISICKYRKDSDYSTVKGMLWNFHTSLLTNNYPAIITLANTEITDRILKVKAYSVDTGLPVGEFNTLVKANAVINLSQEFLEINFKFKPSQHQYHINISFTNTPGLVPFSGIIEYMVLNNILNTAVNMEQVCATW